MSGQPQIVVILAADGTIRAETRGILGEKCLDFVSVLEDLIDGTVTASTYTQDWTKQENPDRQEDHDIDRA